MPGFVVNLWGVLLKKFRDGSREIERERRRERRKEGASDLNCYTVDIILAMLLCF